MEDENVEVVRSEEVEEGGNAPATAPSEPTTPAAPAEPVETAQPAEPVVEAELFELPDGRKVDADTLTKEWKENFLPDYTRKSQELSNIKNQGTLPNSQPTDPVQDPEWAPESYEELLKVAEDRALRAFEAKEQAKIDQQKAIEDAVVSQLEAVKKSDPTVNENALFLHATKYGFRDLTIAHQNMKDMSELAKKVQTTTAANIAKRSDPVSVTPGATGQKPDPSQFGSAVEYLRAIKAQGQ